MDIQTVETAATTVTYDGRLLTISSKGVHSTRASVEKTLQIARELVDGNKCPLLFDARQWPGGDAEGWVTVIESLGDLFSSASMLVDSSMVKTIGPFPETIDRLVIPFRIFTDEMEARAFLDESPLSG